MRLPILFTLFFFSGAAALVYEVLWLSELGRLFGVTAHAAATTLAVFFLGLSTGSIAWGRRAARTSRPLRVYAGLELGIAASALLYFGLVALYRSIYGELFAALGSRPALFLGLKFLLAALVLFPPAFFMGGTLPVMAQHLIRRREDLGRTATLLYAINTIGAAFGAWAAGFLLPAALGYRMSYGVAIAINVCVAGLALLLSREYSASRSAVGSSSIDAPSRSTAAEHPDLSPPSTAKPSHGSGPVLNEIAVLAFASGFLTLALEVLWTRMFAQVLQNSVYTFATILTVFLIALAAGSGVAHALCKRGVGGKRAMSALLVLAGIAVALVPLVFVRVTSNLAPVGDGLGWSRYVLAVYGVTMLILFVPGVAIGAVFPFLLQLQSGRLAGRARGPIDDLATTSRAAGTTIGNLASINTVGAIAGSLVAGFALLDWMGLWKSIWLIAALYLTLALLLLVRDAGRSRRSDLTADPSTDARSAAAQRTATSSTEEPRGKVAQHPVRDPLAWGAATVLLAVMFIAMRATPPNIRLDATQNEKLVELWEGSHGTVAVTDRNGSLSIKVDNSYLLGTSGAAVNERMQAWIPLALHPDPDRVFFLGMGTGITAGGSLDFPVESVTVAELNPDVIEAARAHLSPYLNGLFADPRVRVIYEDGRNFLAGTPDKYDVVVSDIFLSYRAGAGSLYTREHFSAIRDRLEPDGIFAQWLPLFDVSPDEMGILVRTMLDVFPRVTLWRRGFSPRYPIFVLIGQNEGEAIPADRFRAAWTRLVAAGDLPEESWIAQLPLAAYVTDFSSQRERYQGFVLSTDDRTPLEYTAPVTERNSKGARTSPVLAWIELGTWLTALAATIPPEVDPYLAGLGTEEVDQVRAGLSFYQYATYERMGKTEEAARYRDLYEKQVHASGAAPRFDP